MCDMMNPELKWNKGGEDMWFTGSSERVTEIWRKMSSAASSTRGDSPTHPIPIIVEAAPALGTGATRSATSDDPGARDRSRSPTPPPSKRSRCGECLVFPERKVMVGCPKRR